MWFHQHKGKMFTSKKNMAMASLNAAVFVLGFSIVSFYPSILRL
jgi:hypothetical protein